MAKFQCPEGTTSVSVGGEQFNADEGGHIDAPDSVASLLEPHGFRRVFVQPAADKPVDPPSEQTGAEGEQTLPASDTPPAAPKTKKAAADKPVE
ncbi:hypothetical protein AAFM71_07665 [Chromobacterium violaceum]|uniref:hypothetical protein n=1 Tax=Chromobacterium violaceum TaxID=536 RepID=UPI00385FDA1A